nr:MAG TPA: hypothetical protein [Caudoviricetes sp.]
MEVTTVNKTGISKIGDITIKYSISTIGEENAPKDITANIYKDERLIGFYNASKNGVTGFTLQENNGLTASEVKQVFQQAIDDTTGVFVQKT